MPAQAKDCYNLEVEPNHYKCCFFHEIYTHNGKFKNKTDCDSVNLEDYKNMANKVKTESAFITSQGGIIEVYEIDCSSNYLYISLLLLIALLF